MNAALIIVQVILTTHDKTSKLINYRLLKKNPHIDKKIQKKKYNKLKGHQHTVMYKR